MELRYRFMSDSMAKIFSDKMTVLVTRKTN